MISSYDFTENYGAQRVGRGGIAYVYLVWYGEMLEEMFSDLQEVF